jgi:hypothetical protein
MRTMCEDGRRRGEVYERLCLKLREGDAILAVALARQGRERDAKERKPSLLFLGVGRIARPSSELGPELDEQERDGHLYQRAKRARLRWSAGVEEVEGAGGGTDEGDGDCAEDGRGDARVERLKHLRRKPGGEAGVGFRQMKPAIGQEGG